MQLRSGLRVERRGRRARTKPRPNRRGRLLPTDALLTRRKIATIYYIMILQNFTHRVEAARGRGGKNDYHLNCDES